MHHRDLDEIVKKYKTFLANGNRVIYAHALRTCAFQQKKSVRVVAVVGNGSSISKDEENDVFLSQYFEHLSSICMSTSATQL